MNRYLFIPLVITLVGFSWVWSSQDSRGERVSESVGKKHYDESPVPIRELLPAEEAEAMILKEWPTLSPRELMSRIAPVRSYHVSLIAEPQRQAGSDFLWVLHLTANFAETHYPIHIDRISGATSVFADNVWQPYEAWRVKTQSQHEHLLTGKDRSAKNEVGIDPEALPVPDHGV